MNKRDAINHIRQFGGRLDRFRKSVGGSGDGGRNAPKRAKSSPKPVNRKTNVFNEQVRYAFRRIAGSEKQTVRHVFNGDGYRHLPDAAQRLLYGVQKTLTRRRRNIIRHRKSLFTCKKRWTMTPQQAW